MRIGKRTEGLSKRFPRGPFAKLFEKAVLFLRERGYRDTTIKTYLNRWNRLARFVRERYGSDSFTVDRALAFLDCQGISANDLETHLTASQRGTWTAIRMITELVLHDSCSRRQSRRNSRRLPPQWKTILDVYCDHIVKHGGLRVTSAEGVHSYLRQFLYFLADNKVWVPKNVKAFHIHDFLTSRVNLKPQTISRYAHFISRFFHYLYVNGLHASDLSKRMPKIREIHNVTLPTIWTPDEVERLLAAVDRACPLGKRNYAMLILAIRFGMRVGDIKQLRLENLHWDENRIIMMQSKTEEPLVLPLTEEVGSAIIDYLKNGRPVSKRRELFLSMNPPFEPLGRNYHLWEMLSRYRRRAGIPPKPNGGCGMHSLRHTLASRLLEAGTPMQTIADILGHASVSSTKHYVRIDIETLRRAALELVEA